MNGTFTYNYCLIIDAPSEKAFPWPLGEIATFLALRGAQENTFANNIQVMALFSMGPQLLVIALYPVGQVQG